MEVGNYFSVIKEMQSHISKLTNQLIQCQMKAIGITSDEITDFIENAGENVSKNFAGVFLANQKNRFADISKKIKAKQANYTFMILNTDANDKPGIQ